MIDFSNYIDPSIFASMAAIIIAVLVSAGMSIKIFWGKIKNKFQKSA